MLENAPIPLHQQLHFTILVRLEDSTCTALSHQQHRSDRESEYGIRVMLV